MDADVPGTQGYEAGAQRFIAAAATLDFHSVCADFVPFLPAPPARVLDLGAGAGQNSVALAALGHKVTALEPLGVFRAHGQAARPDLGIQWLNDALPRAPRVDGPFDFILAEAVWHHLTSADQNSAVARAAQLLAPTGILALSLRNGPAGVGSFAHPTDPDEIIRDAQAQGLRCHLDRRDLPSQLPGKPKVRWARLVFRKSR